MHGASWLSYWTPRLWCTQTSGLTHTPTFLYFFLIEDTHKSLTLNLKPSLNPKTSLWKSEGPPECPPFPKMSSLCDVYAQNGPHKYISTSTHTHTHTHTLTGRLWWQENTCHYSPRGTASRGKRQLHLSRHTPGDRPLCSCVWTSMSEAACLCCRHAAPQRAAGKRAGPSPDTWTPTGSVAERWLGGGWVYSGN